jgi:DNA-binding transcriptional ArsR family regulator
MRSDEESRENMASIAELLRRYIVAMSEPTRGAILSELEHTDELTPTQLARRLGLSAHNVYHHMRVLRAMGVVDPPRAVPRETYVEKYYRIAPELREAVRGDPGWIDRIQGSMTAQDRQALFVGMCLTMAQALHRAARRYEAMDAEAFDEQVLQRSLGMISINEMGRSRLQRRLKALRDILRAEREADAHAPNDAGLDEAQEDVVLIASLPYFWDVE